MGGRGVLEASNNTLPCSDGKDSSSKQGQQITCAGPCHIRATQEANAKVTRTTAQLHFQRRRCKTDGLKEHYTLDLAGRLVIYNNKFAVIEHRGLTNFPYLKGILSPPTKFGFFLS